MTTGGGSSSGGSSPGAQKPAGNSASSPAVSTATWRSLAQTLATALAGNDDPQAVVLRNDLAKAGFAPETEGATQPVAGTVPAAGGNVADLCGLIVAVVPLNSATGAGQ